MINRKYVVVAMLSVSAVVFGVVGTVAPPLPESELKPGSPQQRSESNPVAHFQNPPTYDSSWVNITDKAGQRFNITHSLNSTDFVASVTGKSTLDGGEHQTNLGGTIVQEVGRRYGFPWGDQARSVVQTADGGYAIAGDSDDILLVKTDSKGNMEWNRTYSSTNGITYGSLALCSDNGFAIAGCNDNYFFLMKTDAVGNTQWNRTYVGSYQSVAYSIIQTSDSGFALVGTAHASTRDAMFVKTDAIGDMQWNKTYGGGGVEEAYSVVETADGDFAIGGWTTSYPGGDANFWLVKTDAEGNSQWNRTFGGTGQQIAKCVILTNDDGFALAGRSRPLNVEYFWLVKTDSYGAQEWNRTYGGATDQTMEDAIQTSDEGFVIVGSTLSYGAGLHDYYVVKTDSNGLPEWSKTYGSTLDDFPYSVVEGSDGGYVVVGGSEFYNSPSTRDFWAIKADVDGNNEWFEIHVESGLVWTDSTKDTITLCRGYDDRQYNYVRVRVWLISEPTWIYGDINMDGVVDAKDLYIIGRNYGKTLSLLSLTGIAVVAGIRTVKKRKQNKQPSYIS